MKQPGGSQRWEDIMAQQSAEGPLLFTMRQLNEHTADVVRTMNEAERVVIITRMGRFVATMHPLANIENLEGEIIAAAVEAGDIDLDLSQGQTFSSEEVLATLSSEDDSTS